MPTPPTPTDGAPLAKMRVLQDDPVAYALPLGNELLDLRPYIGGRLVLRATGALTCAACGKRVKKFYGQGFCYPCLLKAPEAAECIVRPELCRAHLGEGRDPEWERLHHAQEHVVYLSLTGGAKVGVTRSTQVPVRWIDQGAVSALVIARVPYRQLAGLIEVDLKQVMADKTDWRAMLRDVPADPMKLTMLRERIVPHVRHDLQEYLLPDAEPRVLRYPVLAWPPKVVSAQLGREALVGGRLVGVKGQYLLWEDGRVLNVRNHTGYHVEVAELEPL